MASERFLQRLGEAVVTAGGEARFSDAEALSLARDVWGELAEMGPDAYPNFVQRDDLRFVCQWDEHPPVLTVMVWDDTMWRDVEHLALPAAAEEA